MEDMQELATKIRKDSAALWEWREKLPETKRPKTLEGLKDLLTGIQVYVEKNNHYQRTMDSLRHEQNAKHQGRGDEIVRPAWEAKTGTREFPWSFDTNFREMIKIFHHCFVPIIEDLKKDLTNVSRKIDAGLASLSSTKEIRTIRKEMSDITESFQWLQEHWRIHFVEQIDSSGKESTSFMEVPPGVPNMMRDFDVDLTQVRDRQNKLEEKCRGTEANQIAWWAFGVSVVSILIALGSIAAAIWLK